MSTKADDIVHRLAAAMNATDNGIDGDPVGVTIYEAHQFDEWDADAARDGTRRILESAAKAALGALKEGDVVGDGLVVARVGPPAPTDMNREPRDRA